MESPSGASAGGPDSRVVRTLVAVVGLALAAGLAWYVADGYRRSGPAGGTGDGRGPTAAGSPADTATSLRARRGSGRSRWLDVPAPVVPFPTLSGDTASLAGYRGQAVVLNFWATWCPPCKREIPELARLQDWLRSRPATVVGVAVASGSREEVRAFGREHGIDYPVWLSDPSTAASEYRAVGLPLTLLVDRRGVIRRRYMGAQTFETLRADVRAVLDSTSDRPASTASDPSP